MKRLVIVWLAMAVVVIFCSHEVAFSGGGGFEDPNCSITNLPAPTNGPYVTGRFTVALDKSLCSIDYPATCTHYNIHVVLEPANSSKFHLFSYPVEGAGDLCNLTDEDLVTQFKSVPCLLKVGKVFGIPGTPVLTDISVKRRDCRWNCDPGCTEACDTCPEEMIEGSIKIRIVPPPK